MSLACLLLILLILFLTLELEVTQLLGMELVDCFNGVHLFLCGPYILRKMVLNWTRGQGMMSYVTSIPRCSDLGMLCFSWLPMLDHKVMSKQVSVWLEDCGEIFWLAKLRNFLLTLYGVFCVKIGNSHARPSSS